MVRYSTASQERARWREVRDLPEQAAAVCIADDANELMSIIDAIRCQELDFSDPPRAGFLAYFGVTDHAE